MPAKKSLSIAFLYDDSLDNDNGVTQSVKILGQWLAIQGHRVSYLVGETKLKTWSGAKVYSLSKNVGVSFNHNRLSMPLISRKKSINNAIKDAKPDVVHVTMPYSPFMAQRVINSLPKNVAVVGAFHILPSGLLSDIGTKLLRAVYGKSLDRISYIAGTSPKASLFAANSLKLQADVIPNPVDMARFKTNNLKRTNGRIVFLGRLVDRKGAAELIKAYGRVAKEFPNSELLIGGSGPNQKNLERLVDSLGLGKKVAFKGYIPEEDKPDFLAGADIACFPSLYGESFGIVLIEAMAAGAGVVLGGNNPGYASVLGFEPKTLFDSKNTQEFAVCLRGFLANKELASSIHQKQQHAVKQYDIEVVGRQWIEQYERVIAKRQKTRHN